VPRRVARYEPYTVRRLVPRIVQSPNVLSYSDPYSVPLSLGRNSWMPAVGEAASSSSESVTYGEARPADASSSGSEPQQGVKKVETIDPTTDAESKGPAETAEGDANASPSDGLELNPSQAEVDENKQT
jgi:hypothetical protein